MVKWIMKYLWGTSKLGLCFGGAKSLLVYYTDVDMVGDVDARRSTFGLLLPLLVILCLGNQGCKSVLPYPQPSRSSLRARRHARRCFG